jgi:hypothetical protein
MQKLVKVGKSFPPLFFILHICIMKKPVIIAIGACAAAGVGYLLFKGTTLKETADNINVSLLKLPQIHKIDFSGLTISADLRVDNPAKGTVKLKLPSIRLFYKGKMIASTAINDKTYTIDPVASGKISGIKIEVGYFNLIMAAPTIISDFQAKGTNITDNFGFEVLAEVNGIPLKVQKL